MKSFNQFSEQIKKIPTVPYGSGKEPTPGKWSYGHDGPPIHGLKSGSRYPNDIMDTKDANQKKQYMNEPEVKTYFKNNPKTWRSFAPDNTVQTLNIKTGNTYK